MSSMIEFVSEEDECPVAKKLGLTFGLGAGIVFIGIIEMQVIAIIAGLAVAGFAVVKYLKFLKTLAA